MIGPLPTIYRWRTIVVALLVCVGVGVWLASSTAIPLLGALVGALTGVLVAYALLHDFSHRPQPVRVRHRH